MHEGGRPTDYREEYNKEAYKLCLLGAKDSEIADFFEVTEQTINNWKIAHPKFFESIKKGKSKADGVIAKSLFHRAKGYSHKATKFFQNEGEIISQDYTERYPPDTTAAIFWLKNRKPELWRDRKEIEHSGEMIMPLILDLHNDDPDQPNALPNPETAGS